MEKDQYGLSVPSVTSSSTDAVVAQIQPLPSEVIIRDIHQIDELRVYGYDLIKERLNAARDACARIQALENTHNITLIGGQLLYGDEQAIEQLIINPKKRAFVAI